ncbi:MAG TPA: glycoside hydrolase family 3 N-terminal domain-containing protein [Tichowtungia sp.]|nr:glycoside hydrolase family 3 N-terminal domain-containing protein [Tichowtungia sp.]
MNKTTIIRLLKIPLLLGGLGMFCGCAPSLEEKAAQILMVGFRGSSVDAESSIARDIREYGLGAVILFDADVGLNKSQRNIQSPEQLAELTADLQSLTAEPLLIAMDQEGGRVNRLKTDYGFPATVSFKDLGDMDDLAYTYQQSLGLAEALAEAGINLNLAPVVDLAANPDNFIVKKERTLSAGADVVCRHARQFIQAHHDAGVLCTLKHFPGHGSSMADSRWGLADVSDTWQQQELEPYRRLCDETDAVMTAHVFHRSLDPDWPATLSSKMINGLLRREIGYQGVVISDDLGMKAIADHYGFETAVERALNAGVDILLIANNTDYNPDAVPQAIQTIVHLVKSGRVSEARIDEAFQRIRQLKQKIVKYQDSDSTGSSQF